MDHWNFELARSRCLLTQVPALRFRPDLRRPWPALVPLNQFRRDHQAQSLVELSLILPVFLLLVTGIFVFGIAFTNWLVLTDATSLGGRTVAIYRGNTLDPCSTASTAVAGAAPGLNTSLITYTSIINGTTYSGTSCSSSTTLTGASGNLVQGGSYVLTTSYPCRLIVFGQNLAPSCTLKASVKELVQ